MRHPLVLVWICYGIGVLSYWLKRAYYGINPPNPIANGYTHWFQRSWAPLTVRGLMEAGLFWLAFTPGYADKILASVGWSDYDWAIVAITHVPPIAFFFGHSVDSIVDMGVSKVPFINKLIPQMPGPLPTPTPEVKP